MFVLLSLYLTGKIQTVKIHIYIIYEYIYLVINYVIQYYVLLFTKYTYVILSFFPYSIYGSNLTPVNKQLYKKKKTKIY